MALSTLSTHTHTLTPALSLSCTLALENANRVNIPILSYTPADTYNFGWGGMPYVRIKGIKRRYDLSRALQ